MVVDKPRFVRITLVAGAVVMAVLGQALLARQLYLPAALVLAIAVAYWFLTFGDPGAQLPVAHFPEETRHELGPAERSKRGFLDAVLRYRSALFPIPLGLAVATFLRSGDNTFTLTNVIFWILSVFSFLLLFAERPAGLRTRHSRLILTALLALLLLGGFFYFYNLPNLPGEMTSDHAEKLQDIFDVLHGKFSIFFTRNTGREPLEFYLVSAFIKLTHSGLGFMDLKWVTASIGLLVVPLTLALGWLLFDGWVGFFGGAFVAINLWGIGIARMGLRFPFTPFFSALTFLFLFRALKHQRRNDYLLAGLSLGAGLYGYHAFKIAPLIVAACLALWLFLDGRILFALRGGSEARRLGRFLSNATLLVVISVLVFMPLLRYMVDHPESFWQRVLTRVSTEERPLPGDPILIFADNVKNDLLMFNVQGDQSWPNTLSNVPVLDEVSGGLLVLGVAYALYRLFRHRETLYAYLLIAATGFLLPSALAIAFPIENPSVVRAGGAIPFVFLLVALPLARMCRSFASSPRRLTQALAVGGIVALIFASAMLNYNRYFVLFDAQYRSNSWNSSEMAQTILDFAHGGGSLDHAWVVAYPYWVDTRNIAINLGDITWENVTWHVDELPDATADQAPRLYILSPADETNLFALRTRFPQGSLTVYNSKTRGKEYVGYLVPGERVTQ